MEWLFGLVAAALGIAYKRLSNRFKKEKAKQEALCNGMRVTLKNSIIERFEMYEEREYCPISARENLEDMYEAYRALGGNGTVTTLMEHLRRLPTEPPHKREHIEDFIKEV